MINQSMNRIIGDFMEINSDIVVQQFNSKLPKFISKWLATNKRKKLLKTLDKFRNSDYILVWNNIVELLIFVYNNFEPEHKYKVVENVTLMNNKLEAFIKFDNYQCLIYFEDLPIDHLDTTDQDIWFNLKMHEISSRGQEGMDIQLSSLKGSAKRTQELLGELNYVLKNTICDYIEETIQKYMEE